MSTHRSCCCEDDTQLYGLLVKQMRYRHDLVPHVEFPTKNFFFVKGTGVNTKGGRIIPELSFWFDPDDADRWKDANWQAIYEANPDTPYPSPSPQQNYYRTDEYGAVPDPRIGNNTAKTNGIAWDLNTIGVSFSEPIFLGTHEDLYVKGFAGGTGAYFFKNGNIPGEIESSKTIDSELEIWNTLILPSSLSGVCVGNPDSIWNYIDRFCELEDTGECTQRITSQIKNEGSPGVTLPGNKYNAIPLDRVRKYPYYIWDASRTQPNSPPLPGWTAGGNSEWYYQQFRARHPFTSISDLPNYYTGYVFSGNIQFFKPKNDLRSLDGLTVSQQYFFRSNFPNPGGVCGWTGAWVYKRVNDYGRYNSFQTFYNYFFNRSTFKGKRESLQETPYWLWSEFDIPTMHLDDGILELSPHENTPEYSSNNFYGGDWRSRYNTNIQKRRPEVSTVFNTIGIDYFDSALDRRVGITATSAYVNYNSSTEHYHSFGSIFDVKGANTSSWKYRPIITEFYTTAMNHQCEMKLFFEKIEDAVVDGITFTYTRQRLPSSVYTSYTANQYSPVRRDVYNNVSYTTKVGATRTGAFNIFQNELIQYKDPRGITKHFNVYATDSSYILTDINGVVWDIGEIRGYGLVPKIGAYVTGSTEDERNSDFYYFRIQGFFSNYEYTTFDINYSIEPQEAGPTEPAHLHFVNTFFEDFSIKSYTIYGGSYNRNKKYNSYTRELFAPLNSPTPNRLWHYQNNMLWRPPLLGESTRNEKRPPYPDAEREPYQYYLQPGNVKFTKEWLPIYGHNESGDCDVYENVPVGQPAKTLSISPCELPLENDTITGRRACPKLKYKDGTTYSVEVKTTTKLKVEYSSGMENLAKSISSNSLKTNPVWIYSAIDKDYVSRLKQYVENNDLISIKTYNTLHNEFFKQCCRGSVNNCIWARLAQDGNDNGPLKDQLLVIEKETTIVDPGDCNSRPTKNAITRTVFDCWINPDFYIPKLQVNDYGLYLRSMYTKHRMNYTFFGGDTSRNVFEDHQWHHIADWTRDFEINSYSRGWSHLPLGNRNTPYHYNYDPNEYVKVFLVSLQKISYLDPKDNTTKTKLFIKDSKEIEVQNLSTLQLQHPEHVSINSDDPFKGPNYAFGTFSNVFEPEGWKSAWPSSFFPGWDPVYNTGTEWELAIPGVKTADEYLADKFEITGDDKSFSIECPGGINCDGRRNATLRKKNTTSWGSGSLFVNSKYYKEQRDDVLLALRKYYNENTFIKVRPEWRVNVNYELWSTVENGKISFNNTPWGTTLPNNTEFLHTIRNLCAPRSRTEGLNWDNAVPVYYQIIPGATYYFKNGQKYPDPITNYYSDYSMFAWYFPGTRDPNPERFRQHSKNWWSRFNKNGIVMGHWNPCLYSKATPADYKYYGPYIDNQGFILLTDDYNVLHTDQWWDKNPFWKYPKSYNRFRLPFSGFIDGQVVTSFPPEPEVNENVYGNNSITTSSFHMSGSTKLHDSYLLNMRSGFFWDYNIILGFYPNIKAYEITELNNYWLSLKQYAKDVVKCAESNLGSLECTKYFRGNHTKVQFDSEEPTILGLTAYSDSEKVFRKACKKLVDHFGVTWPVGTPPDQIQKEKYLNLDLFPVDSLHKMNKNEVYDFDFPKYVTTDPDFEAIFWKNSTAPARCCNSERGSCFDGSYAECVKAKGTWIAGKKCSDPDSC